MGEYDAHRTLATDYSFKERVREDMLIRLLDAFVWRNQGISTDNMLGAISFCLRFRGNWATRLHIRARHERPRSAILIHHAIRNRGLLLLRGLHRE